MKMKSITIQVEGMSCEHCVMSVTNALLGLSGVQTAEASLEDKKAYVTYDETKILPEKMVNAINEIGYKAAL